MGRGHSHGPTAGATPATTKTTSSTVTVYSPGQMGKNTKANGKMESSTVKALKSPMAYGGAVTGALGSLSAG
jgi:hypothetical protein